ncbi:hypothetical protein, partial [Vibrio cholerae]|uniref:hypothetical protein n=1 Tax=Vibrio cholerae TaxID=666 RepID=UPI001CA34BD0
TLKDKDIKMITKKWVVAMTAIIALAGCASTEQVKPQAFDANSSYAYNIANQTALTRNKSPLKDFTAEDIEKIRRNIGAKSGGDLSVLFGALSILTGNFTGVIDVVGGTASNIAKSRHTSKYTRYIIALDKEQFKTALEAEQYIYDVTQSALEKTMQRYSDGTIAVRKIESYGDAYNGGFNHAVLETEKGQYDLVSSKRNMLTGQSVKLTNFNLNNNQVKEVWGYGINEPEPEFYNKNFFIAPPMPLAYMLEDRTVKYDEFYKEFTSHLPDGFYVYTPPFPTQRYYIGGTSLKDGGEPYNAFDTSIVIPAIYTKGEKHEFLKP